MDYNNSSNKILLIIPAFNEEESISYLADDIINNYKEYDYIIINDGSKDGTAKLLKEKGYSHINLPINLGIGGAVQMGYIYAKENGYDIAVQIDGDGQHDVSFIEDVIKPIQEETADIVIGSRFVNKDGFQSTFTRRVGISFLSSLIRLLSGVNVKDVTSGFRAVNERFIAIYADDYPHDYPEPEAIISAKMHGAKILEVPVKMKERMAGESSITFRKSVYYMIKVTLALIICRIGFGIRRSK